MKKIKIGNRIIGEGYPPFVIAEAGINHNGEIEKAHAMIKAAKEVGADAVKFQTFKAEEFISDSNLTYTYKFQGQEITESMLEMFKRCEFKRNEWFLIKKRCDEEGIMFLSTPQNCSDLDLLLEVGIPAIKVGSDDFNNTPLLKSYSQTKLPMVISCGMSNLAEVYQALEAISAFDGYPAILMLCTSQYPTPPKDVNLLKLKTLVNTFPEVILGFSDHTQGCLASSLAVALGAIVFEKHFTLDHDLPGPDHWFSEDPHSLKEWVISIRKAWVMIGSAVVRPTKTEEYMKNLARRSIAATCDINEGDLLSETNIGIKRPGTGLPPMLLDKIIGLQATCPIPKGNLLQWGDFK